MEEINTPIPPGLAFSPLKNGGATFTTCRLKETEEGNLLFAPTFQMKVISLIFLFFPLPFLFPLFLPMALPFIGKIFLAVFCLISFGVALFFLRNLFLLPRFDFERKAYYKSITSPRYGESGETKKDYIPFSRISGLQIVAEMCRGSKGSTFFSYELNLVLTDGKRMNVVDHGSLEDLKKDARLLAGRLEKPLWMESEEKMEEVLSFHRENKRKGNKIAGFIFLGVGLIIFTFAGVLPFVDYRRSLNWIGKEAIVRKAWIDSRQHTHKGRTKTTYALKVEYSYRHNGKNYTSRRYQYPERYSSYDLRKKRSLLRTFPPGKKILCFINPARPEEAAIQRDFLTFDSCFPVIFSLIFAGTGGALIAAGRKKKKP